jgi:hypothetical protein
MKYKILHLPTATYMYYNIADIYYSVMYTEYEALHDSRGSFECIFETLESVGRYIDMGISISKLNKPDDFEYEFEPGVKSNVLFCHFEIQEVKDDKI